MPVLSSMYPHAKQCQTMRLAADEISPPVRRLQSQGWIQRRNGHHIHACLCYPVRYLISTINHKCLYDLARSFISTINPKREY